MGKPPTLSSRCCMGFRPPKWRRKSSGLSFRAQARNLLSFVLGRKSRFLVAPLFGMTGYKRAPERDARAASGDGLALCAAHSYKVQADISPNASTPTVLC